MWVCGRMGASLCKCVYIWVRGCVGAWVHGYPDPDLGGGDACHDGDEQRCLSQKPSEVGERRWVLWWVGVGVGGE